jgi:hypothetical protein
MRTIETKLYLFDELSEAAQKRAIADAREWITNYDWWDFAYDDFIGKYDPDFSYDKLFTIESMQSFDLETKRIYFKYSVNLEQLEKEYPERWPKLKEWVDYGWDRLDCYIEEGDEKDYQEIEEIIDDRLSTLKFNMLDQLRSEWDYLNSNESIKEVLSVNPYEFTENGKRWKA